MTQEQAIEFIELDKKLTSSDYSTFEAIDFDKYCNLWNFAQSTHNPPTIIVAWRLNMLEYQQPDPQLLVQEYREKYKDIKAPQDKINIILKGKILQEYKYIKPEKLEKALNA